MAREVPPLNYTDNSDDAPSPSHKQLKLQVTFFIFDLDWLNWPIW